MVNMKSTLLLIFISCAVSMATTNGEEKKEEEKKEESLQSETLVPAPTNCTRKVTKGDIVHVYYVGTFANGSHFENHTKHDPFAFKQGEEEVIKGWEQGVEGMCVGEKKKLTIPPTLAYGVEGYGDAVPPNTTLVFELHLVNITDDDGSYDHHMATSEEGHKHANVPEFEHMDVDKDHHLTKEEIVKFLEKEMKEVGEANFTIKDIEKTADDMLKEHDVDQDGKISFEENQHFAHDDDEEAHDHEGYHDPNDLDAVFKDIDTDEDKHLSVSEVRVYLMHIREHASKEEIDHEVEAIFSAHDLDQDELITEAEVAHAKEIHNQTVEHHGEEHHDEDHHEGEEEEEGHGGEL